MRGADSQIDMLAKLLDVASVRHGVLAENVANVNTPGYHQRVVSFEEEFARELARGGQGAASHATPRVVVNNDAPERADGNNVDMDVEMTRLNKNTILYRAFAQILIMRLGAHRSAIAGH